MTVSQPIVRAAQVSDLSILSEYWYDRMALIAHKQPSAQLPLNMRLSWEQNAAGWLHESAMRSVVSVYADEVVGGLFVRRGLSGDGTQSPHYATVLALVIDLHTIHQRQGVGRVLWQAMRTQLHQDSITRVYAAQTSDMLENTFWPSLGATLTGQWFELDI
jgi:hypothetical protein